MRNWLSRITDTVTNMKYPNMLSKGSTSLHRQSEYERLQRPVNVLWYLLLLIVVVFLLILLVADVMRAAELAANSGIYAFLP